MKAFCFFERFSQKEATQVNLKRIIFLFERFSVYEFGCFFSLFLRKVEFRTGRSEQRAWS